MELCFGNRASGGFEHNCLHYLHPLPVNVVGATELVGKDTQTGLRYPLNHFLTTVEEE